MDLKEIELKIEDFRINHLGKNWEWRPYQKETIIEIIQTYFDKNYNSIILEAPCGSGKSIIALCVTWVLNKFNSNAYILASDLTLQEQYEKDFNKFALNFFSVKGIDNYNCLDNDEKISLGTCKLRGKAPKSFGCYTDCPYYSNRDGAIVSETSLLNYAYWLIQMNYVKKLFSKRSITFCDECHKLLDIVQNHYSPRINENTITKLEKLTDFFNTYKVANHWEEFNNIKKHINMLWNEENQDTLLQLLTAIEEDLESYIPSYNILKETIDKKFKKTVPKEWRTAGRNCDWLKDLHCKLEDYVDIIKDTTVRNLIKNPQDKKDIIFNCLEENYLMNNYFHKNNNFTVYMSATISDPKEYMKTISLKNAKFIKMDSSFDFSKSPIYFYNKRKMSYKHLENNLEWLYKKVDEILDKHHNIRGIIHSVSYSLSLKIYNNISKNNQKRLLIYSGTEEKKQKLEELKVMKNGILIGPSLTTGIDLPNELSRLQLWLKMPYLSLSDRFVKVKMENNWGWYNWNCIISLIQGTGRSHRNKEDYCETYILDGCMADLISRNRVAFPKDFLSRIVVLND